MAEPNVPSTDDVRLAYVDRQDFLNFARSVESMGDEHYEKEFNLWLRRIQAAAYRHGFSDAEHWIIIPNPGEPVPDNPYED